MSKRPGLTGYFWLQDERLGFRNRLDGSYLFQELVDQPEVTTDGFGYRRGLRSELDVEAPTIVLVGDSTTFCAEVSDRQTPAAIVEARLGIQTVNAGVRGYNSLQAARMLEVTLDRFPHAVAAVYTLAFNDYSENLRADRYTPALAPHLAIDGTQVREVEVASFVSDGVPVRNEIPPAKRIRVRFTNWLRERSAFAHHGLVLIRRASSRLTEQDPVAVGDSMPREQRTAARYALRKMAELCRRRGVKFFASRFTYGKGDSSFGDLCADAEVVFLDASTGFSQSHSERHYMAELRNGSYDPHWGSAGAKAFGEELAAQLKEPLGLE